MDDIIAWATIDNANAWGIVPGAHGGPALFHAPIKANGAPDWDGACDPEFFIEGETNEEYRARYDTIVAHLVGLSVALKM